MEAGAFTEAETQPWYRRLPLISTLGNRVVDLYTGAGRVRELHDEADQQFANEEAVLNSILKASPPPQQYEVICELARVKAKRFINYSGYDDEKARERLYGLRGLLEGLPDKWKLERLGFPFEEAEMLRINLKALETE